MISSNLIGRVALHMTLHKPLQAVYITFLRRLVKEFFIYSEVITLSPEYLKGWRIFAMACRHPWTKSPSKNLCSRQLRIVNAVASLRRLPAGRID